MSTAAAAVMLVRLVRAACWAVTARAVYAWRCRQVLQALASAAASLEALRQVHREELASYKQRAMDAKQLESIENKVKDTVGQLMLLQAQMADRAAGLDVLDQREGGR